MEIRPLSDQSEQQSIRDELSQVIVELYARDGETSAGHARLGGDAADAILASPVIRRIQAEALREAAESLDHEFQEIPAWNEAYREGVRTEEWMRGGSRMVVSAIDVLLARAARIEKGDATDD